MKTFKLFLEDFKEDEAELQTGKRISNIDLAHSMALTTCAFEFECFLSIPNLTMDMQDPESILKGYNIVAEQLSKAFDTKDIHVSKSYHGVKVEFKIERPSYWFIEPDGSLSKVKPKEGYFPIEMISPWIPAKDAIKFIAKFKKEVFAHFKGYTNDLTGFHVNYRTKNAVVNPLKLLALLDEEGELNRFKRDMTDYAKPQGKELVGKLRSLDKLSGHYDLSNPEILKAVTEMAISRLDREKYRSVNFKDYNFKDGKGRVEFRIIGDDYLGSLYKKTLESVDRFTMLIASATDDTAHNKEVAERFNKKLEDVNAKPILALVDKYTRLSQVEQLMDAYEYLKKFVSLVVTKLPAEVEKKLKVALAIMIKFIGIKTLVGNITDFSSNDEFAENWTKILSTFKSHTFEYYVCWKDLIEIYDTELADIKEVDYANFFRKLALVKDDKEGQYIIQFIKANENWLPLDKLGKVWKNLTRNASTRYHISKWPMKERQLFKQTFGVA